MSCPFESFEKWVSVLGATSAFAFMFYYAQPNNVSLTFFTFVFSILLSIPFVLFRAIAKKIFTIHRLINFSLSLIFLGINIFVYFLLLNPEKRDPLLLIEIPLMESLVVFISFLAMKLRP